MVIKIAISIDVWTTHTEHCSVCQNALKNINRLTVSAFATSIILTFLSVIIDARAVAAHETVTSFPTTSFWLTILGAVGFASIGYLLMKLRRLFYVYEFEHARND